MSAALESLADSLVARYAERVHRVPSSCGELTFEVGHDGLPELARALRDEPAWHFEQLIDLSGVDYLDFGRVEWNTQTATSSGFSRGVESGRPADAPVVERRFAVVYHLLSMTHNRRLRLRAWCEPGEPPLIDSVIDVWKAADWYEREAFDLYGIVFRGHPDLRRILTDYGFIGHPFRKDFPLSGNVEVRYDPAKGRVVYEPVSIEPRTLVPKVIREDNRYAPALKDAPGNG
jgi:NADH-quinone oxidoreductase subunit C